MKRNFYLLPLLLFLFTYCKGQDCSSLSFTYSATESRCVATGSITVTVNGGSGNYNFKAIGPITTPLTSSNIITGLPPGYYSVVVRDLNSNCTVQQDSIFIDGSYNDPRFQLTKVNATCAGNDGSISTLNQQFGRSPFTYTIIDPSPSKVGESNATGDFTGLVPGEYAIELQDSCGGIQVRRITIDSYNWWFDSVSVVRNGCTMADVYIRIKDNKNNVNTSGTAFDGFQYGYVLNGDTTWNSTYAFSLTLGTNRQLVLVVKDDCGNIHSSNWNLPNDQKPALNPVNVSNLTCTDFTASVTGPNLTTPNYCLYDTSGNVITCNGTGTFNNLVYGSYCVKVFDGCYDTTITKCFIVSQPAPSVAPVVAISNTNCSTFTASITGQSNLTTPSYCLYDTADVKITCNTTGIFNGLAYGSYCIKVHDVCTDSTISRCFTEAKPVATLTGSTITGTYCNSFGVSVTGNNLYAPKYCLYDTLGNVITCDSTGIFDSIPYGNYCVRAITCGDTTNSICFSGSRPVPSLGTGVQPFNRQCSTFSVSVWGRTNLTDPQYCLYNDKDSLIACDSTGAFTDIPYGSYCIKLHNNSACYDTLITRCFTEMHDPVSINTTMQVTNTNCSTVSFKVNGTNLTNPTYCLYNASNTQLECNTTGSFNNYPFGQYCVTVHDGCIDTTMKVCQTFGATRGISLTTSKSCLINSGFVDVAFNNNSTPYSIKVYHPNGSVVYSVSTSSNPYRVELKSLPAGTQYKVIATDACGNKDSASITLDANLVTKRTTVRPKCPSALWLNGSGDILATSTSNWFPLVPLIIKKNGGDFVQSYSSLTDTTYTFADLEPAQYVVQYTQNSCNGKLYDTVTVSPYAYPTQGHSAIYQCDNNGFSLSADVRNGVSPYSFEIIGSTPDSPSIVTAAQTSPIFSINNGTTYSLIRLRTIDACGNATLSDVSVLPLQNFSVKASDSCFYQNITLQVDTIPNATYTWYKKTTSVDSVLLDSGLTYNLPFFQPEQIGLYECKLDVNNGCLQRMASFNLTGNCYQVLPTSFLLSGRKKDNSNQLLWNNTNQTGIIKYIVERKQRNEANFSAIGSVPIQNSSTYQFYDNNFTAGSTQYRLKAVYVNKTEYSNIVILQTSSNEIVVYPNPVRSEFRISLSSDRATDYKLELVSANGQLLFTSEAKNILSTTLSYTRDSNIKAGIYLLRITDKTKNRTEIRKLVFE
ncbi:MAG: T9SS type A sorting domain-containing protein [Flavisolibacter sp.]